MSSQPIATVAATRSRYATKRRHIRWDVDPWVAILKMAAWAEVVSLGAFNSYTMWTGLEVHLHTVNEEVTGEWE
jgi:hypothetical protein